MLWAKNSDQSYTPWGWNFILEVKFGWFILTLSLSVKTTFWHWNLFLRNLTSTIILIFFLFHKWCHLFAWICKWFTDSLKIVHLLRYVCFVGGGSSFPNIQCAFSIGRLRSCISEILSIVIFSNMHSILPFWLSSFGLCMSKIHLTCLLYLWFYF